VSNRNDIHARCIANYLKELHHEVRILDFSHFGSGGILNVPISDDLHPFARDTNGIACDLGHVRSVWYRRPANPRISAEVLSPPDVRFAQNEWNQTIDGMLLSLDAFFVNPILAQRAASKPYQLKIAQRIGLRIPDTLITNSPHDAQAFITKHNGRVVHKSMTPHQQQAIYTQKWKDTDYAKLESLMLAPTIFQEEISGERDIRITVIGDKVFTASITTSETNLDSRLQPDVPYEVYALPKSIERLILDVMQTLGLVFGCIDMRLTHNHDYVFFEVNPQGQFLYIEIWTSMPIARTLAQYLDR
jgi:glutathione synthase/RimK-type ligase-like ATP-grasp enzyme